MRKQRSQVAFNLRPPTSASPICLRRRSLPVPPNAPPWCTTPLTTQVSATKGSTRTPAGVTHDNWGDTVTRQRWGWIWPRQSNSGEGLAHHCWSSLSEYAAAPITGPRRFALTPHRTSERSRAWTPWRQRNFAFLAPTHKFMCDGGRENWAGAVRGLGRKRNI
jgi:hypothetical protein